MAAKLDYAIFSLYVYEVALKPTNRPQLPEGWEVLELATDNAFGFSYGVFRSPSGEVVVSYTGTNEGIDWVSNLGNGAGIGSPQATAAALVYLRARDQYGANITFTGHSLGAGLASIMAVWFDRPAVVFDEAPFELTARNPLLVLATKAALALEGRDLGAFLGYNEILNFATREQNVQGFFLQGEALQIARAAWPTISASQTPMTVGGSSLSMVQLHSMALYVAADMSPSFRTASLASERMLPMVMAENLYAFNTGTSSTPNFLIDLIRGEQSGNTKLSKFGSDMQTLGANRAGLSQAAQDAIIAQGIEWYYWQSNNYAGQEFVNSAGGILQYTTAKGDELQVAESKANNYVTVWLDNYLIRQAVLNHSQREPSINPDDFSQWNVATGSGSVGEALNQRKTQIFIGNQGVDEFTGGELNDALWGDRGDDLLYGAMGADKLYGGTGQDELYGGEGDDRLEGGAGSDKLDGGAGDDTYLVGNGIDYIKDDEAGEGNVRTDKGVVFVGGIKEHSNLWKSDDETISYVFNEATGALIIMQQGLPDALTIIQDFDLEAAEGGSYLGISLRDKDEDEDPPMVSPDVATGVTRGVGWFRPGDPLVLDLDGDGIELTSSNQAVLFDHNADTLKTGTQWVRSDDGMLVRDLNGNGAIDSGRELFGDQTRLSNGQTAANGFAALAPLDNDADGLITSADAAYAELHVWRDLNQDGVSQEGELQALASLGITGIHLNANAQGISSFTRTVTHADGTTSTVSRTVQNINFTTNPFYREFADDPEVAESVAALPQIRGSGFVRDLRQAMSLGTSQAAALEQMVASFKAAETAQQRQALLSGLANDWAATSSLADATVRNPLTAQTWYAATLADAIAQYAKLKPDQFAQMTALERFSGQVLLERYARQRSAVYFEPNEQRWKGYTYYVMEIEPERMSFFDEAYAALKSSIYEHMYVQTAGRELLDQVQAVVASGALRLDFSAVNAAFATQAAHDPAQAVVNLAEFLYFTQSSLQGSDWDGAAQLAELLQSTLLDASHSAVLAGFNYKFAGPLEDVTSASMGGSTRADVLVGRAGDDTLSAGSGNDILIGGAGNDQLIGGYGNDQLVGGQGNDYLNGQWGTDTYFWGAGQGSDYIHDGLVNTGEQNTVVLRGLNPTDVSVELVTAEDYRRFRLTLLATGETLTLDTAAANYWEGSTTAPVRLVFSDGSQWGMDEIIRQTLPMPTEGDDVIIGTPVGDQEDRLNGGAGNDVIVGRGGRDVMEGGVGDDHLYGNAVLSTWAGGQPVSPYWNVIAGSLGDSDVYVLGRGDGQDTIHDVDYGVNEDVLRFKEGVSAEDLELSQRGKDLVARIRGSTDQVTIKNFFGPAMLYLGVQQPDVTYAIERFEFADGTTWSLQDIRSSAWAGTEQDDNFSGDAGDNVIGGSEGNDVLDGGYGHDSLSGGAGDDVLQGGNGDDVLDGGAGDDMLYADYGADTIRFGRGDGQDVLARDVNNYGYFLNRFTGVALDPMGNNVVKLKEGVGPSDVKLVRKGTTLTLQIKGTSDALTIKDFFVTRYDGETPENLNFSLREIRFEDGTRWGPEEMLARTLVGDESNETFSGFESNEVFDGGGGNDQYFGGGGDDVYLFGRGDGHDTVKSTWSIHQLAFKEGVQPEDVVVRRVGNSAVFTIQDTGDSITFEYAYAAWSSGLQDVSAVTFADGSSWTPDQINQLALEGTDGDDAISDLGIASSEVLAGGLGNDRLIGDRTYSTVYVFNRGDGQDTVDEAGSYSGDDTLRFGPDIVASDLVVRTQGEDLVIGIAGSSNQVTIKRHANSVIEKFEVGGVTLTYQEMLSLVPNYGTEYIYGSGGGDLLLGTDKDSIMQGYGGADSMAGNGGSDVLHGSDGDDVLAGGTGRDRLVGGLGSNVYRYNRGDGLDIITLTPGASDSIELGEGIIPSDLSVQIGTQPVWRDGQPVKQLVIGFGGNDALVLEIPYASDFASALRATGTLNFSTSGDVYYGARSLASLLAMADAGVVGHNGLSGDDVTLRGSQADDNLYTDGGSNTYLFGRDNDDTLSAWGEGAVLDGGNGQDELEAGGGGAVMAGGRGDDLIHARSNEEINTVVFNRGDGRDRIEGSWSNGQAVLSFGVGIDPSSLRMRIDSDGDLVITIVGSDGDEVRTNWYEGQSGMPSDYRGIGKLQFIDELGRVRVFDISGLDSRFDRASLSGFEGDAGVPVLSQAPELEVLGLAAVYGGLEAMSYAQWGEFGWEAYIAANDEEILGEDYLSGDNLLFGTSSGDEINAEAGNDVVMGGGARDYLYGQEGDDYLDGQSGDDWLFGGAGDDVLVGGSGDDYLDAGPGHNKSYGGAGDDWYYYEQGDGFLYIEDGVSFDGGEGGSYDFNVLEFSSGISLEDLVFERDGDNLKITVGGAQGDVIMLAGFDEYEHNRNRSIDELVFNDGASVITLDEYFANQGDGFLLSRGEGQINGTEFNDHLVGGWGDDVLNGGYGDNRLEGGAGNDAYVLGYGSGSDVIVDTANDDNIIVVSDWGVTADDVALWVADGVAEIQIGTRLVRLEGWDGADLSNSPISTLVFEDGSTLSMNDLFNRSRHVWGTPLADVLQGGAGGDQIWGLQGNDLMQGGAGADTYVIESESGADTITDTSTPGEENTLLFLDGTQPEDIRLTLDAEQNLVLQWADGMQVTLTEFEYQDPLRKTSIAFFQFGEAGPVLSYEELLQRGFEIEGTAQNDVLHTTGLHDVVRGGDGDDVILGSTGDDNLFGGAGNDVYEYRLGDGLVGIDDVADASGGNVVRFGADITPELLERKLRFHYFPDEPGEGSLRIVFDENNILQLNGFDPLNPEGAPHAVEHFEFADGTVLSWDQLLDKIFVVEGEGVDAFDENLSGTSRSDRLYGYAGNDVLVAHAGDDVLTGGTGADVLQGGAGTDNYVFQLGDGTDTIQEDGAGSNTITFGEGIFEADITVERDGADFVVRYGSQGDTIRIVSPDGVNTPTRVIDHFELADGTLIPFAQYVNHAPEIGDLLQDQQGRAGEVLSFEFSGGAFLDQDGSELSYRALLVNGEPLPDWLTFNPQTRSFSGTPPLDAVGNYEVAVFAVDPSGAAMQQQFRIQVDSLPNQAPEAQTDEASVQEDVLLSASGNVLVNDSDPDANGALTVANAGVYQGLWGELELLADGSYVYRLDNTHPDIQALGQGHSQTEVFSYVVSDGTDVSTAQLIVTIVGSNDAPVLSAEAATVQEDLLTEASGSVLAAATDADGDTLLVVEAGVHEGQYGTLTIGVDGRYRYVLRNTSTEIQSLQAGQVVQESFSYSVTDGLETVVGSLTIDIVGSNDGPQVFADTAAIVEDAPDPVQGNVLDNDRDGDAGAVLQVGNAGVLKGQYGTLALNLDGSYSYTLYDDASVQALAAGQGVVDVFSYIASDGLENASTTLTVTVTGANDAPVIVSQIGPQTGREGQAFSYLLPESLFLDVDQGDALSYVISQADGQALPGWLSFNPATRMLSGTPGDNDAGVYQLRVTASDQAGASVSSLFSLTVDDRGVCTGGVFEGTSRADTINGTECADVINGHAGNDQLYGQGGNDVLNGGLGVDFVSGGAGNDNLQMSVDALWGMVSTARHRGSPGVSGSHARISLMGMNRTLDTLDGGSGWDTLTATNGSDAVILDVSTSHQPQLREIEQFDLGAGHDVLDLTSTRFGYGAVVANGGSGNDVLWSSSGNDRLYGGSGCDVMDAGAGDDFVDGGDQDDRLISLLGYGNDILRGGAGNDLITDLSGQNLLDGGAGSDVLLDGGGNSVLIGGKGNDVLKLGQGHDVLVFNRGDGRDTVIGGGGIAANDTLVLGGGIRYEDLSFRRDGRDLVLRIGQDNCDPDQIRLENWYLGHRSISRLEIAIDTADAYQAGSPDPLLNRRTQSFDFEGLVARFNEMSEGACDAGWLRQTSSWSLTGALMDFHLGGTDDAVTGGDLSHYYAHQGTLSGLSLGLAQAALARADLGETQQSVSPLGVQASGAVRL